MSAGAIIFCLAYLQSIAFSMVSRARNRDNHTYHAVMAVISNGVFFLTMRELVVADLSLTLIVPYIAATVAGSLSGAVVSLRIEHLIGANA